MKYSKSLFKVLVLFAVALSFFAICSFLGLNTVSADETGVPIDAAHFPDENFRQYVSKSWDSNSDGYLSDNEADACNYLSCPSDVKDMTGVEYFSKLTSIYVWGGQLAKLDVSKNTALRTLNVSNTQLTSLDLSKNTELNKLICTNNKLTSLNISANTALWELECYGNQLTALDVRARTLIYPN